MHNLILGGPGRCLNRRVLGFSSVVLAVLQWTLATGDWLAQGAEPGAVESAAPRVTVANLHYRVVDYVPLSREIEVSADVQFTKTPPFAPGHVFRGVLRLGTNSNQAIPFAWEEGPGKLYLDLNRNRDLTDDAAGRFIAGSPKGLQLFTGISLPLEFSGLAYQTVVDAHVFGGPHGLPRVFLHVRSLWDGVIELQGARWYLAVIDNADGTIGLGSSPEKVGDRFILRRWIDREQPNLWWHASLKSIQALDHAKLVTAPYRWAGNAEVFDAFNVAENVFIQNHAYRLSFRLAGSAGPPGLQVTFAEARPKLGRLKLEGDHIRRLVLENGFSSDGFNVILDSPAGQVEVPIGNYPRQSILLQREGFTNVAVGISTVPLAITASNAASWSAGGPLTNSASVESRMAQLRLDYQLVNAGGISFKLVYQDRESRPEFAIRQGDQTLAGGRFEYG